MLTQVRAVPIDQLPAHVLDEVLRADLGRRDAVLHHVGPGPGGDGDGAGGGGVDLADRAGGLHCGEDEVPSPEGLGAPVPLGLGRLGGPDQAGQERSPGEVDLPDVDGEVGAAGGLDAVRAPAEVDGVEVTLEDHLLVQLLFELHREGGLPQLAEKGPLVAHVDVLHVLLGDRGPALQGPAPEVGDGRPRDGREIDAGVGEEVPVLGGEDGVDQHLGGPRRGAWTPGSRRRSARPASGPTRRRRTSSRGRSPGPAVARWPARRPHRRGPPPRAGP